MLIYKANRKIFVWVYCGIALFKCVSLLLLSLSSSKENFSKNWQNNKKSLNSSALLYPCINREHRTSDTRPPRKTMVWCFSSNLQEFRYNFINWILKQICQISHSSGSDETVKRKSSLSGSSTTRSYEEEEGEGHSQPHGRFIAKPKEVSWAYLTRQSLYLHKIWVLVGFEPTMEPTMPIRGRGSTSWAIRALAISTL